MFQASQHGASSTGPDPSAALWQAGAKGPCVPPTPEQPARTNPTTPVATLTQPHIHLLIVKTGSWDVLDLDAEQLDGRLRTTWTGQPSPDERDRPVHLQTPSRQAAGDSFCRKCTPSDRPSTAPIESESECLPRSQADSVGAPEGIRTPNLLIRSQMLYPLSYGRRSSP